MVLFGKNVQKYVLQARIKIGKFLSETEVLTTDIIEGNLIGRWISCEQNTC